MNTRKTKTLESATNRDYLSLLILTAGEGERTKPIGMAAARKLYNDIRTVIDETREKPVAYIVSLAAIKEAGLNEKYWLKATERGLINSIKLDDGGGKGFSIPAQALLEGGKFVSHKFMKTLEIAAGLKKKGSPQVG